MVDEDSCNSGVHEGPFALTAVLASTSVRIAFILSNIPFSRNTVVDSSVALKFGRKRISVFHNNRELCVNGAIQIIKGARVVGFAALSIGCTFRESLCVHIFDMHSSLRIETYCNKASSLCILYGNHQLGAPLHFCLQVLKLAYQLGSPL